MHRLMEALNIVSVTVTSETSQRLNCSVALELVLLKKFLWIKLHHNVSQGNLI